MTNLLKKLPALWQPYTEDHIRQWGWEETVSKEVRRRFDMMVALDENPMLREKIREACARDVFFFIGNFGYSYDPRPEGLQDLPTILWRSQEQYVNALLDPQPGPLLVEKSRDQGASVIATQGYGQKFLFCKGWDIGMLTRIGADLDDKTYNSLFGKLDYLFAKLPPFILYPGQIERRGGHAPVFKNLLNGNIIRGANTTRGTMRGFRLKKLFVDEAAHIEQLSRMMSGLKDVGPGLTLVSSVNGQGNAFADVRHGRAGYESAPYGSPTRRKGAWGIVRLHYSDDPRKGPGWAEEERRGKTVEDWAQEQEIEYNRSSKYRIFDAYDPSCQTYSPEMWAEVEADFLWQGQLMCAWDFGTGAALTCNVAAHYFKDEDLLIVHDYNAWQSVHWRTVADDHGLDGYRTDKTPHGLLPISLGDRSGGARDSSQKSWIKNLAGAGIQIQGRSIQHFERSRQAAQWALMQGKVMFAPSLDVRRKSALPSLQESLLTWRYKVLGEGDAAHGQKPDKESIYSHLGDCLLYLTDEIWGVQAEITARTNSTMRTGGRVDPIAQAREQRRMARFKER